jgi:FSR family fosmidomycin resistance protein-like MFS transporter
MVKMDRRGMALLALAHTADDINQGFLPAVLPLLIITYHFSLQAAGALVLAQAISSSVIQPAIGHLADKRPMPWLIWSGLLLAGLGIGLIGMTSNYVLMFASALLSGLGVAMFHPEAARYANYVSGTRKASGMRWFSLGGTTGFAIGPAYATLALGLFGQHGTWLAVLPVVLLATLIYIDLPRLRTFQPPARTRHQIDAAPDRWGAFVLLSIYTCLRSTVYVGIIAFIPIFFIREIGTSLAIGNLGLTLYLGFGALGAIAGGSVADRFGRKAVMVWSAAGTALLLAAFAMGSHNVVVGYAIIALAGFVLVASNPALVVVGQEYLPNHMGTASGVTLGIAVSVGGMMSPVLGHIGDVAGVPASFYAAAALALLAAAIGLLLPAERRATSLERATSAAR